ncbi:MAG: hypothetical protein QNL88_03565 [Acidobacteriota bacterium]|nr:hypothetical protein [Acidobacteriota bacterium]
MRSWQPYIVVPAAFLAVLAFVSGDAAAGGESVFAGESVLSLTIRGPLGRLAREEPAATEMSALLEFEGGEPFRGTISTYGISRLAQCSAPPLKITFTEDDVRGTPFEGHHSVRLMPACHYEKSYGAYILLEYLTYRSYAVMAKPALRTRLVSSQYRDTERPSFAETGLGLIIEEIDDAAKRNGKSWLDIRFQRREDLDPAQVAIVALFQYMVGNTDWSVVASAPGQGCCHNTAILGAEGDRFTSLLPFDFDQAGLVNAPYAVADKQLGIGRVTQRVYRGYCWHNDEVLSAIYLFNSKRLELEELFKQDSLPDPYARKRALKYLQGFYETINTPKKREKRILNSCRQ